MNILKLTDSIIIIQNLIKDNTTLNNPIMIKFYTQNVLDLINIFIYFFEGGSIYF